MTLVMCLLRNVYLNIETMAIYAQIFFWGFLHTHICVRIYFYQSFSDKLEDKSLEFMYTSYKFDWFTLQV